MTRILSLALVLGMVGTGTALAQTAASPRVNPPAVSATSPDAKGKTPPVAGANSFTEAEARSRIEAKGFADVTGLKKDENSVWRGKATKAGASVDVALDFQGTVVAN